MILKILILNLPLVAWTIFLQRMPFLIENRRKQQHRDQGQIGSAETEHKQENTKPA
jgi:hypothetical protein